MIVLHYIPSIDESSGGVGAYLQLLSKDLGKLCELHVLTHHSSNERKIENCSLYYFPCKWSSLNQCKRYFIELIESIHPDVFHTNSCWTPLSALTAIWAKNSGYKVIYTPHGMLEPWSLKRHKWKKLPAIWLFQRKGIAVSDLIHTTADKEKNNILKLDWNRNIHVVANCVQVDEIKYKFANCTCGFDRSRNILFLGRIHPVKGINFLIEAANELKNQLDGYTITIAGDGKYEYMQELKNLAIKKNVYDMVNFIGPVFGDDKWQLYRKADIFVLPSHTENFGIVIAEALASGTPVITTYGTPWAELNEAKCGWCVEIGTQPLVDALRSFLACSEEELQAMGQRGRKLVEDKYSSEIVAKQFLEMYNALCQKQK